MIIIRIGLREAMLLKFTRAIEGLPWGWLLPLIFLLVPLRRAQF
jgi:hypothetical protein